MAMASVKLNKVGHNHRRRTLKKPGPAELRPTKEVETTAKITQFSLFHSVPIFTLAYSPFFLFDSVVALERKPSC